MVRSLLVALAALAALFGSVAPGWAAKRALIVGINDYRGENSGGRWRDLRGAVNDAEAMRSLLVSRFGFAGDDVVLLRDAEATRERILAEIEGHLVAPAKPGDVAFFHFAGHGSQVRNAQGQELDRLDETIVPADSRLGAPDIRDKELRVRFNDVLDRGADLVAVFDSCSSGSILRSLQAVRFLPPGDAPAPALAPERRAPPEERGALLLSAASSGLPAAETKDAAGRPRGALSFALIRALREAALDEPADQLFLRVRSALLAEDLGQAPVLAATSERRARPLLGGEAQAAGATRVGVLRVRSDGLVELDAGAASGLNPGAELVSNRIGDTRRLRVVEVPGVALALARVSGGDAASLQPGDLFRLDRWSAPDGAALRILLPEAAPPAQGKALHAAAAALRVEAAARGVTWVEDPTTQRPTHRLVWRAAGGWMLRGPDAEQPVGALDPARAASLVSGLPQGASLLVELPPAPGLRRALAERAAAAGGSIELVGPEAAHFALVGVLRGDGVHHAWVRPGASLRREVGGLPPRSDWTKAQGASAALGASLDALLRIRSWLTLPAPPDEGRFPYRLALRRESDGRRVPGGAVRAGERYRIALEAERPGPRSSIEPRYVYVFAIDAFGRQALVFPTADRGNAENRMPPPGALGAPAPPVLPVGSIEIAPPFGHETLVMVTSATPLADPRVLEGRGVRTRTGSALEQLLGWVGTPSRAPRTATPTSWGIQRLSLVSLPRQGE